MVVNTSTTSTIGSKYMVHCLINTLTISIYYIDNTISIYKLYVVDTSTIYAISLAALANLPSTFNSHPQIEAPIARSHDLSNALATCGSKYYTEARIEDDEKKGTEHKRNPNIQKKNIRDI